MSFLRHHDSCSTQWYILIESVSRFYSPVHKKKVFFCCNFCLFFILSSYLAHWSQSKSNRFFADLHSLDVTLAHQRQESYPTRNSCLVRKRTHCYSHTYSPKVNSTQYCCSNFVSFLISKLFFLQVFLWNSFFFSSPSILACLQYQQSQHGRRDNLHLREPVEICCTTQTFQIKLESTRLQTRKGL